MVDVKTEMAAELRRQILSAIAKGVIVLVITIAGAALTIIYTLPGRLGLVQTDTVAAFARKGCPTGWEEYKEAWGRFIIGAVDEAELGKIPGDFRVDARGDNLLARELGRPGGAQTHQLTISEMPAHDHGGQTGTGSSGAYVQYPVVGGVVGRLSGDVPFSKADHTHSIAKEGENKPHSIIPPFVALTMCRKL